MTRLVSRTSGQAIASPACPRNDVTGAFLASKRSRETRNAYRRDITAFARHMGASDPAELLVASIADVISWRDAMQAAGRSSATVARRLSGLRTFYRFAASVGAVTGNPAELVEAPKVEAARAKAPWLENGDARALLEAPDTSTVRGKRDRAILELLLRLGLRRGEVVKLTAGDIQSEGAGCNLRVRGKGGKTRYLAMNGTARAVLSYLEAEGRSLADEPSDAPLFPGRTPGRALTGNAIYRLVVRHAKSARVVVRGGESLAPHGCRRTYATRALDAGVGLEALRRAMGHSNPATTARYDRRPDADVVVDY